MTEKGFVDNFLRVFAANLSQQQNKKLRVDIAKRSLMWDIFASQTVACFEGDVARAKYDSVDKVGALAFLHKSPNTLSSFEELGELYDALFTSNGVDKSGLFELYIVGHDFKWCYVVTHAGNSSGPFFCYAPKNLI